MAGDETIYGHVLLTGYVEKEGDQFASYCRELGSASGGDTMEEALENLGEAIEVHLEALEDTGELLRALRERNIRIDAGPPDFDGIYIRVTPGRVFTTYSRSIPLTSAATILDKTQVSVEP